MHLKIVACDLDGTLAEGGIVTEETWRALREAKEAGFILILVTGRKLDNWLTSGTFGELFDAIVAEDGAAVHFPGSGSTELPFGHLAPTLVAALQARGVPVDPGLAIVATHVPHDAAILEVLKETGGGATVEYNRGAVMVLPPGATKGTGIRYALEQLGLSARNVMACGDAENDRSLFEVAELAVAVANVAPGIAPLADVVLPEKDGSGVRQLLKSLAQGQLPPRRPRPERQLFLGYQPNGEPVHLDPFALVGDNTGIVGETQSGKSWLAGLLAEELLQQGYQLCVIDPEGEYAPLHVLGHVLVVGGASQPLPPVEDLVILIEQSQVSVVLDLSQITVAERSRYAEEFLRMIFELRGRLGRPHWFLIDEAQSFCPACGGPLGLLLAEGMRHGGVCLVSYRPGEVTPRVLDSVDHWLLTCSSYREQLEAFAPILARYGDRQRWLPHLQSLEPGQACWFPGPEYALPEPVITFTTGRRLSSHVRHLHKYLQSPLPEAKRFYFRDGAGRSLGQAAATPGEFVALVSVLPVDSLESHLYRGDFERWFRDVFHDEVLARRMRTLVHRAVKGEETRRALADEVSRRCEALEALA
jgi:hydroxymethylpyrimidine pyrophosphatase-like HAD family hydrolase